MALSYLQCTDCIVAMGTSALVCCSTNDVELAASCYNDAILHAMSSRPKAKTSWRTEGSFAGNIIHHNHHEAALSPRPIPAGLPHRAAVLYINTQSCSSAKP